MYGKIGDTYEAVVYFGVPVRDGGFVQTSFAALVSSKLNHEHGGVVFHLLFQAPRSVLK